MKKKSVFDAFAVLAYLKKESQYEKVKNLLLSEDSLVLINEINVGEIYYVLARERGRERADYFIHSILSSLPITKVSNTFQDVIEAARIKAEYSISYADCFAVATAMKESSLLVTGDPDFKKVEEIIEIDWL